MRSARRGTSVRGCRRLAGGSGRRALACRRSFGAVRGLRARGRRLGGRLGGRFGCGSGLARAHLADREQAGAGDQDRRVRVARDDVAVLLALSAGQRLRAGLRAIAQLGQLAARRLGDLPDVRRRTSARRFGRIVCGGAQFFGSNHQLLARALGLHRVAQSCALRSDIAGDVRQACGYRVQRAGNRMGVHGMASSGVSKTGAVPISANSA